jgi:uncharacterized protein YecT (DUF1311 family)
VIAAAALLLFAQADSVEPDQVCDDPQTQLAMNTCASMDFNAADAALNEQWAITARDMRNLDEQIDRDEDQQAGHYETLLTGQRAWLAFRDAQCRSESFFARGGSLQPALEFHCKAFMTELRIQQLRDLSAGPE